MTKTKVLLSWSSGKDSAWALHRLRQDPSIEVVGLFTTLNEAFERVAMHGVRKRLLEMQAECVGLPLHCIDLPWPCSNEEYGRIMTGFIAGVLVQGIHHVAFGDLFLEEVRAYREKQLAGTGLNRLFLHAAALKFTHPGTGETLRIEAPLDEQLKRCLQVLRG